MKTAFSVAIFFVLVCFAWGLALSNCGDDDDDSGSPSEDDDDAADDDSADDDDTDDDATDDDAADDDATDDDAADDDSADDDDSAPTVIAYIYFEEDNTPLAYHAFLEDEGYVVDLYDLAELSGKDAPDFTEVEVFLTDANTVWEWDETTRALLTDTGKPIVAIGGGSEVYLDLDQYLTVLHTSSYGEKTSFKPKNLNHAIWDAPYDLEFEDSDPVKVYETPGDLTFIENDGSSPEGTEFLGQAAEDELANYYSVVVQDVKYGFWGFDNKAPTDWTQTGQKLLINLIEYVQTSK